MGYYLFDHAGNPTVKAADAGESLKWEQLRALLEEGRPCQRQAALRALVAGRAEAVLTRCLASEDPTTARLAMNGLWECWLGEKGLLARARMDAGIEAMNNGNLTGAAGIFSTLMSEHPSWAEPLNKQATVLYLQGMPEKSIALCRMVVGIKPDHFGAWNGMTLCAIQIENWALAIKAVRESLRLQPRSGTNLQLLKLVETRLPTVCSV